MGFRFRKSFKIAPGVRMNVGKKGVGMSFGGKGLRYSVNSSGRRTTSASIPGTGLSYVSTSTQSKRNYKTNAYQNRSELLRQEKEKERLKELERARLEVRMFENKIEVIKSIHKESDEVLDWNDIYERKEPFNKDEIGPGEKKAKEKYDNFKPNFFEWLFKMEEKAKEKLKGKIQLGKEKDAEIYKEWEELHNFAKNILDGDIDTYFKVIEEMAPLDDLSEYGSGFEFFGEESNYLEVEFDVNSKAIVPKQEKTLTKTGKLSVKEMSKTKYYDIFQDYVCSCTIRIARDMFALLPLEYVYINAYDYILNTSNGNEERTLILSVKIEKYKLNELNFETIDCSDSMNNFEHNMNFKKTTGFSQVDEIKK